MSNSQKLAENPFVDFYDNNNNDYNELHDSNKLNIYGNDDDTRNNDVYETDDLETPTQSTSFVYPSNRNLEQRENDLRRREEEIDLRENNLKKFGRNNWPAFYPLIYLNIKEEIPHEHRYKTTFSYYLWIALCGTLILNWIGCLFILIEGEGFEPLAASSAYLVFITPASFLLWFRPLYNALMKGHAFYYLLFLFFGAWHIIFSLYCTIGFSSTGGASYMLLCH